MISLHCLVQSIQYQNVKKLIVKLPSSRFSKNLFTLSIYVQHVRQSQNHFTVTPSLVTYFHVRSHTWWYQSTLNDRWKTRSCRWWYASRKARIITCALGKTKWKTIRKAKRKLCGVANDYLI